jgi:hypothetical protein
MKRRIASTVDAAAAFVVAATGTDLTSTGGDIASPGPSGESTVALASWSARAGARHLLRPDMFSLRARTLRMTVRNGFRVLRFSSMLANGGRGPMVVRPRPRADCPPGHRLARQLISVDRNRDRHFQRGIDTREVSRRAGCMVDHPTHHHWHFEGMAAYRLVDPGPRRHVVTGRPKVSFCLRDNQPIPGTRPRQRREYFGDCGRNLVQGISPGWVDLYDLTLPGQSLRLPRRMRDGVYCLVTRADPQDQLLESDETNNARARPVRINGTRLTTPDVRVCRGLFG